MASRPLFAWSCLCALGGAACSLSAPTAAEYSSTWGSIGSGDSAGSSGADASSSGSSSAGQGSDGTQAGAGGSTGGSRASGGATGDSGAPGDDGTAGALGTAGGSGTAGAGGTAGATGTAGDNGTAGGDVTAGAAGTAGTPLCSDAPLTKKSTWVTSASGQYDAAPAVVLDNSASRWTTGKPQNGGEWLQIDFGASVSIRRINLQQGEYGNDYPRSYSVYISNTSHGSSSALRAASGVGSSGVTTTIVLPKTFSGRYLYIKQLSTSLSWWSVEELEVSCYDG